MIEHSSTPESNRNEGEDISFSILSAESERRHLDPQANADSPQKKRPSDKRSRAQLRNRFTIKEVVARLFEWRHLSRTRGLSFRTAANAMNTQISIKTLDDQLRQVKIGAINNFDFKKHKDQKISALRRFNREHGNKFNERNSKKVRITVE